MFAKLIVNAEIDDAVLRQETALKLTTRQFRLTINLENRASIAMLKIPVNFAKHRHHPLTTKPTDSPYRQNHRPAVRVMPQRQARYVHDDFIAPDSGSFNYQLFEFAKARQQRMKVDVSRLNENPRATDTELLPHWRTILVPKKRIEALKSHEYHYCSPSIRMWNIGYGRSVENCNPYDVNPGAIDYERIARAPGKGPFDPVARGAYGNRNFKYLWAIDHQGMHIAREMTPCEFSSRGIITHSLLVDKAIVAGEIFFDIDDPYKVFVNFGSGRFPLRDVNEAEHTAEFLLALDYRTVIAMIPNRDLKQIPYGMADRYGSNVESVVFRRDE